MPLARDGRQNPRKSRKEKEEKELNKREKRLAITWLKITQNFFNSNSALGPATVGFWDRGRKHGNGGLVSAETTETTETKKKKKEGDFNGF